MRLGFYRLHLKADLPPPGASRFSLAPDHGFSAGGHGGAAIPVPIPNTEVKGSFAEGSAGPARARVGRRRLFRFFSMRARVRLLRAVLHTCDDELLEAMWYVL